MVSEFRIEIDRPLCEVYAAFNNPDNLPRWITGLQRTEPISGTPGQVGAKTRQIYLERGRIVEMIETITAAERLATSGAAQAVSKVPLPLSYDDSPTLVVGDAGDL